MVNITPTVNEFTGGLSKSGKELWSGPTSVADAIGETFASVKDYTFKVRSESYGKSLSEQFVKNSELMKANLAKDGGVLSKSYAKVKRAFNGTLGRVRAGTKGLAQGTWRLPKQLLTHGVGAGVDVAIRGPVKVVGATVGSLVAGAGELLTGTGKVMQKGTDITRKLSGNNLVSDSKVKSLDLENKSSTPDRAT